MHIPRSVLLEKISIYEIQEYMEYYQLYPFGDRREDFRAGLIVSKLHNLHVNKGEKLSTPLDFMPYLKLEKKYLEDTKPLKEKINDIRSRITAMFQSGVKRNGNKRNR